MKTKLLVTIIALTSTLSQISYARIRSEGHRNTKPVLTEVNWMGTLRCEDRETDVGHKKDHKCDLEFVNAETNEAWEVKENPALTTLHQSADKDTTVHIQAVRSPRYLLGGSYVEIKQVESLPVDDIKLSHACSLNKSSSTN